ncbi:MAG: MlaD family protein [Phycisphaerae bacterium]|jgi:phospholipid/cholesterol/gamma-HCH transport system substrate-binding protein
MTDRTRNIAVGLTVIIALGLLGMLILIFTGIPQLLQTGYIVAMRFDSTHDMTVGDDVYLHGIRVGKIIGVNFTETADPAKGITVTARIDRSIRLPANTQATVFSKGMVGKGYLDLVPEGPMPISSQTGQPRYLPDDGSAVLEGVARGNGLFPPELNETMMNVSKLAKTLNEALAPTTGATAPAGATTEPSAGLRGTLERINRTLDDLHAIFGNVQNQENMEALMARTADAAGKATDAMEALKDFAQQAKESTRQITGIATDSSQKINALADKLIQDADDLSRLMVTLDRAARKIDSGQGTLGKLVNDPQLYETMVTATNQLSDLLLEARKLIEAWRATGVEMKFK